MIKYAGLGVAMETRVLPVGRSAADYITASNNDDGVGLVVEEIYAGIENGCLYSGQDMAAITLLLFMQKHWTFESNVLNCD